jgi:hypothetical protein
MKAQDYRELYLRSLEDHYSVPLLVRDGLPIDALISINY